MKYRLDVPLSLDAEQRKRMGELQAAFAQACNAITPMVRDTRCWNRVALHHMAYKSLREQFPQLGSQMACNVIYSVSRASRLIYQHPDSPHHLGRAGSHPLPLLHFQPHATVYFDRHTLSLRNGRMSMFTLDGRMKFDLALSPENERRFREHRLREIALNGQGERYVLSFLFADEPSPTGEPENAAVSDLPSEVPWPGHIRVMDGASAALNDNPISVNE
jgi:hypothetical protein